MISKANRCLSTMDPNRVDESPVRTKRSSMDYSCKRSKIALLTPRLPRTEIKKRASKPFKLTLKPAFDSDSPATDSTASTCRSTDRATFTSLHKRFRDLLPLECKN